MKNNRRNLLFLLMVMITFFSSMGIYLSLAKNIQNNSPFIELMIIGGVLLSVFVFLMIYDIFKGTEEKHDKENLKEVYKERGRNKILIQQKLIDEKDVGKNLMHTHYAFENYRNTIRTLFIVITHCFIFGSMYVFYNKYSGNKEIIIPAVIFGTLSFFVHIGFLFYNLYMQKYYKEYRNTMEIVKDKKFKK